MASSSLDFGGEDGSSSDGYAKVMSEEFIAVRDGAVCPASQGSGHHHHYRPDPGKPAPKLITKEMVDSMKPGSVIVDMAAQAGGNCEYTVPGELHVTGNGVKVIGYTDLPGRLPAQSSQLYGTNLVNLMKLMCKEKDGNVAINFEDVVQRNMTVIQAGEVTFPPPAISVSAAPQNRLPPNRYAKKEAAKPSNKKFVFGALGIAAFGWVAAVAPAAFLSTSPYSSWPAWSVTTWCGTSLTPCTRR